MTLLLSCQSLSKSFGSRILFENLSLSIFSGDRIGLIGPNGSGKSTLLNILIGKDVPDEGDLSSKRDLTIGYIPQICEFPDISPKEVLLQSFEQKIFSDHEQKDVIVSTWLSKLGLNKQEASAARLSGGWKKRLAIAQAMIHSPDLLLLDEPTNHLDLEGILWLEKFLLREVPSYLLVSHDRFFLQNVTNRIIEINRIYPKGVFAIDGPYLSFLEKKGDFLEGQIQQEHSLASKARKEVEWLRQSPKARTTKSRSRVESAQDLLQELSQIKGRNRSKKANLSFESSERETRKLLVAKNISKSIEGRLLFQQLDFTLSPGTRIGLMGPNGSGKTTLLRILAGEVSPDLGTIKIAEGLQITYFDQHRKHLPSHITLREALSPLGDYVLFRGQRIHVNGWCKRFLFSPDMLDMPLEKLSGGERARISIAHLMLQPADLLLLDEPTNDLDIPTLETLEESLIDFPGAVVLITHDRCMLDRICNTLLALGDPSQTSFYADYTQWENATKNSSSPPKAKEEKKQPSPQKKNKLTYAEKQEYGQIEGKIVELEREIQEFNMLLEKPEVIQDSARLQEICRTIACLETKIEGYYLRWDELEKKQQG